MSDQTSTTSTTPASAPEVDKLMIDPIETYAFLAVRDATTIAADKRYDAAYRHEQIKGIFETAQATIADRVKDFHDKLESEYPALQARATRPLAPDSSEAPALAYTKEAIFGSLPHGMDGYNRAVTIWENALAVGDRITLRVMADFHPAIVNKTLGKRGEPVLVPHPMQELAAKTDALLLGKEGQEAAKQAAKNRATLRALGMAHYRAKQTLGRFQIEDEKLVTGDELERRDNFQRVRRSF